MKKRVSAEEWHVHANLKQKLSMDQVYFLCDFRCAKAMFGYMTDLDTVEECCSEVVTASGHDLQSALYNFMNEWSVENSD